MRKRLSDDLDGALAPKKKVRLEKHLRECPGCGAYKSHLARLEAEAARAVDRSAEYWAGFERRLAGRLTFEPPGRARVGAPAAAAVWRWAYAAAGAAALAAVGLWLAVGRPGRTVETAWLSWEDSTAQLLQAAEGDPEFAARVDRDVLALIDEITVASEAEPAGLAADDPLFWEGLSDEELEFIASELAKATDEGGPR